MKLPKGRYNPFRLIYKNYLKMKDAGYSLRSSNVKIDILIPVVEKDMDTLPFVIEAANKYINNPLGTIFIVGKKGIIEDFCLKTGCAFLDEETVLPIKKSDIIYKNKEWVRSGWLFQQLIKLNANEIVKNENVLILDADTCIAKSQSFVLDNGTFILNFSDEFHYPYNSYKKILPGTDRFYLSFISHHIIFNKVILKQLKIDIEKATGENWIQAILHKLDYEESSCFSEYEMYGNYLFYHYRDRVHLEYWNNKSFNIESLSSETIKGNKGGYKSFSFHKYS